jgi:hypothetical protein
MKLLVAFALALALALAPAANANPARDLTKAGVPGAVVLDRDGVHAVPASCGPAWGHDVAVPGLLAHAYASEDGARQVVVLCS